MARPNCIQRPLPAPCWSPSCLLCFRLQVFVPWNYQTLWVFLLPGTLFTHPCSCGLFLYIKQILLQCQLFRQAFPRPPYLKEGCGPPPPIFKRLFPFLYNTCQCLEWSCLFIYCLSPLIKLHESRGLICCSLLYPEASTAGWPTAGIWQVFIRMHE